MKKVVVDYRPAPIDDFVRDCTRWLVKLIEHPWSQCVTDKEKDSFIDNQSELLIVHLSRAVQAYQTTLKSNDIEPVGASVFQGVTHYLVNLAADMATSSSSPEQIEIIKRAVLENIIEHYELAFDGAVKWWQEQGSMHKHQDMDDAANTEVPRTIN